MRISIIREDNFISINNEGYNEIDLKELGSIWAIQWYDSWGEVEYHTPDRPNDRIEDISFIQPYIDKFNTKKAQVAAQALQAAQAAWDAMTAEEQAEVGPRP